MKLSGKVGNGLMKKWLIFGGDFTDLGPYHDTGKTCFGRGMHCPSASSIDAEIVFHVNYASYAIWLLISPHHHNRFTALFPGPPRWVGARRELLGFMVQGRLTESDTLTIRLVATPSRLTSAHLHRSHLFFRPDALPAAQPTMSKHWRQVVHSDEGEDARVLLNCVTCNVSIPDCWYQCI